MARPSKQMRCTCSGCSLARGSTPHSRVAGGACTQARSSRTCGSAATARRHRAWAPCCAGQVQGAHRRLAHTHVHTCSDSRSTRLKRLAHTHVHTCSDSRSPHPQTCGSTPRAPGPSRNRRALWLGAAPAGLSSSACGRRPWHVSGHSTRVRRSRWMSLCCVDAATGRQTWLPGERARGALLVHARTCTAGA
jgi:hypothetical protein